MGGRTLSMDDTLSVETPGAGDPRRGRQARAPPPASTRPISFRVPSSLYDGIGHAPFWEDTTRFNAELAAFVRAAGKTN